MFRANVFKEIQSYKQISFCHDYNDYSGFASPLMWGQYARQQRGGRIQSGVCIEIDSSKLEFEGNVHKDKISYTTNLESTHLKWIDTEPCLAAQLFVLDNITNLFFIKHSHWEHENEYRLISKDTAFLDISNAITAIYVLWEDSSTMNKVKRIVKDTHLIKFLEIGGLGQLYLKAMELAEYESDKKLLKIINRKKKWNTE